MRERSWTWACQSPCLREDLFKLRRSENIRWMKRGLRTARHASGRSGRERPVEAGSLGTRPGRR